MMVMVVMGGSGELGMGAAAAGGDDDQEQCLGQWTDPDQTNCGTQQEGPEKQNQVFPCRCIVCPDGGWVQEKYRISEGWPLVVPEV
jgi:hypothetical protein